MPSMLGRLGRDRARVRDVETTSIDRVELIERRLARRDRLEAESVEHLLPHPDERRAGLDAEVVRTLSIA